MSAGSETLSKPEENKSSLSFLKIIFSLVGVCSLYFVLRSYGFSRLLSDIHSAGWWIVPVAFTFIPTLFCYSAAWQLCTESNKPIRGNLFQRQLFFFRTTVISIAWNNLSPFLKILGEPIKAMLLEKHIGRRDALRSVVLYNVVHLIGTVSAFLIAAILIPLIYPVAEAMRFGCFFLVAIFCALAALLYFLPWLPIKRVQRNRWKGLRGASYWLRWSLQKMRGFYRAHSLALFAAIGFEVLSRFLEGITFFTAFRAIGAPITAGTAAFLDIGRALLDNAFFFIPYQVGSREFGVGFLMKNVFQIPMAGYVTATLFYRMVEIFWMVIGYILWIKPSSSPKSST